MGKVFRFMSKREFEKLLAGNILENTVDHCLDSKTDSKGFCFFEEKEQHSEQITPEFSFYFMEGIVSSDICVRFETTPDCLFKAGHGTYGYPFDVSKDWELEELSTIRYDRYALIPIEYAVPDLDEAYENGSFGWVKL